MVFSSILGRIWAAGRRDGVDAVFMITRGVHASMASSRDHAASQVPDSVLLVVQSYPVSSLAHDQVMHRLRSAKWPVTLRFSRPLTDSDVTPLARCLQLEQQGELPDDLKLQMLKRLLSKGVAVRKHGSRKQAYDTVVYLNETMLFWRARSRRRRGAFTSPRRVVS